MNYSWTHKFMNSNYELQVHEPHQLHELGHFMFMDSSWTVNEYVFMNCTWTVQEPFMNSSRTIHEQFMIISLGQVSDDTFAYTLRTVLTVKSIVTVRRADPETTPPPTFNLTPC